MGGALTAPHTAPTVSSPSPPERDNGGLGPLAAFARCGGGVIVSAFLRIRELLELVDEVIGGQREVGRRGHCDKLRVERVGVEAEHFGRMP